MSLQPPAILSNLCVVCPTVELFSPLLLFAVSPPVSPCFSSAPYLVQPWTRWGTFLRWWRSSKGRSQSRGQSRRWAPAWCRWYPGLTGQGMAGCLGRSCWPLSLVCCHQGCDRPCSHWGRHGALWDHWLRGHSWVWAAPPLQAVVGGRAAAAAAGVFGPQRTGCLAASSTCGRTSPLI